MELLYLANQLHIPVAEVSVSWREVDGELTLSKHLCLSCDACSSVVDRITIVYDECRERCLGWANVVLIF